MADINTNTISISNNTASTSSVKSSTATTATATSTTSTTTNAMSLSSITHGSFEVRTSLQVRPLEKEDLSRGFLPLLSQLSHIGDAALADAEHLFAVRLAELAADDTQLVLVAVDEARNRVVATGTLVVEPKYVHEASQVGHLEDLVVDAAMQKKGLGRFLVARLVEYARARGCYKVIVDCREENIPFYQRCSLKEKSKSMSVYYKTLSAAAKQAYAERWGLPSADALLNNPSLCAESTRAAGSTVLNKPLLEAALRTRTTADGLTIRALQEGDYDRKFLELLSQLTVVGDVSREVFLKRLHTAQRLCNPLVIVVEDEEKRLVASGSVLIEPKFSHGMGFAGHIEDVVVDKNIRGRGLGKLIVQELTQISFAAGCYKVILDCSEENMPFYEKCGFSKGHSPICMAIYFEQLQASL
eukprot:m.98933 g.98933  ORF g.98933 m.98933 type:complete len:415 (+) comp15568_c0_seq2:186-1430(+)